MEGKHDATTWRWQNGREGAAFMKDMREGCASSTANEEGTAFMKSERLT